MTWFRSEAQGYEYEKIKHFLALCQDSRKAIQLPKYAFEIAESSKVPLPNQATAIRILEWEHSREAVKKSDELAKTWIRDLSYYTTTLEFWDCEISFLPTLQNSVEYLVFQKCRFHRRSIKKSKIFFEKMVEYGSLFELNLPLNLKVLRLFECRRSETQSEFKGRVGCSRNPYSNGKGWFWSWKPIDDKMLPKSFPESLKSLEISDASITDQTLEKLPQGLKTLSIANCPNIKMVSTRGSFLFPKAQITGLTIPPDIEQEYRKKIEARLCCQPTAVNVGVEALILASDRKENTGISSIILCSGPTGVGKTEFSKTLGQISGRHVELWKMDQYDHPSKINNLFGSPIGYEGSKLGSPLANCVLKHPDAIIVFDEFDRAEIGVIQSLLTLFSEGSLETPDRKKVDFSKTTIVLTSNIGKHQLMNLDWSDEKAAYAKAEKVIEDLLIMKTSEEFRGRVTHIVPFKPLNQDSFKVVIDSFLLKFKEKLMASEKFDLAIDDSVWIPLLESFNPTIGARGLLGKLERNIEAAIQIAKKSQTIKAGDQIVIQRNDKEEIYLTKK